MTTVAPEMASPDSELSRRPETAPGVCACRGTPTNRRNMSAATTAAHALPIRMIDSDRTPGEMERGPNGPLLFGAPDGLRHDVERRGGGRRAKRRLDCRDQARAGRVGG